MMQKTLSILVSVLVFGGSYGQEVSNQSYQNMLDSLLDHSVREIAVMDMPEKDVLLLDAREANEFKVSRINNARWVGYSNFSLKRVKDIPKDQEVIVYCSVGYRSEKVAKKMQDAGFTDVSNLYGGIFEWVNQDRAVVDSEGQMTDRVHAFNRTWGGWLNKGNKVYRP
jgi:rhodanese-related sulfurtransferase